MKPRSILIAGFGNADLGDDAFGAETAGRLVLASLPDGVHVVDYGLRRRDLVAAIARSHDAVILVCAITAGAAPGTLTVAEITPARSGTSAAPRRNLHRDGDPLDPAQLLAEAATVGEPPRGVWLVGCEPAVLASDVVRSGMSDAVADAVPRAVATVEALVFERLAAVPHGGPESARSGTVSSPAPARPNADVRRASLSAALGAASSAVFLG